MAASVGGSASRRPVRRLARPRRSPWRARRGYGHPVDDSAAWRAGTTSGAVSAHLEVWAADGLRVVQLTDDPVSIGRAPGVTVRLDTDRLVSHLHAVVEPLGGGWCVHDVGSRNGTVLGGERIAGERFLRHGDELRVGQTRIVYRSAEPSSLPPTEGAPPPPVITRRERDVLRALCRPLAAGRPFAEPASLRDIAAELVVTEAAVKQHLLRLYDKFGLHDDAGRRRVLLANEAVRRGAVTLSELGPGT